MLCKAFLILLNYFGVFFLVLTSRYQRNTLSKLCVVTVDDSTSFTHYKISSYCMGIIDVFKKGGTFCHFKPEDSFYEILSAVQHLKC